MNTKRKFTPNEAFIDLLLLASHKDHVVNDVPVLRGQVLTSKVKLAKRWRRDRGTTRRWLRVMQKYGEIDVKATNQYSLITICKYDLYQGNAPTDAPSSAPSDAPQSRMVKNVEGESVEKQIREHKPPNTPWGDDVSC